MPDLYVGLVLRATRQAVVDFIAGMSESAALELFQGMSGVSSGSVLDAAARMV